MNEHAHPAHGGPSRRICDIYASARARGKQVLSFEIVPPRGELSDESARAVASVLAPLQPDYISVTHSAGGSGSDGRSYNATNQVSSLIQDEFRVPSMAHLTCINTTREDLERAVQDMRERGIENVLAVRGDITPSSKPGEFELAKDLVAYLKEQGFCVGAAAYPEGHIDCDDPRTTIEHLKAKQDAGADFFVTQLFFTNSLFYRFREDAVAAGITAPISCGIMPFMSKKQVQRMVFMCGASLPAPIVKLLAKYEDDKDALLEAGIDYAAAQLVDLAAHGVDGLHLYTMNRPQVAVVVKQRLKAAEAVRG